MNRGADGLRALIEAHGEEIPLDRSLLVAATTEYPDLDVSAYLRALDDMGERARRSASFQVDPHLALRQTLFIDFGFRANRRRYDDPKNNLFNEVLDRRLGIPITLAAAYLEVGRRLGTPMQGVGFPGHFLIARDLAGRRVLIDPFAGGAEIDRRGCERLLRRALGRPTKLEPWMLAPASPRSIVARVLVNLKNAYVVQGDYLSAITAIDRLLVLDPQRWSEVRDRGLLYSEIGCSRAAARDLVAYVPHASASETAAIEAFLPQLRRQERLLH